MKTIHVIAILLLIMTTNTAEGQTNGKYANVNGIKMYYEIHGKATGIPLVLIHGGGSTITTNFSKVLPEFEKTHRIIALELQSHGHTSNREAMETFAQDAEDVVELLKQLKIDKADILGFSNGGQTAMEIAIRHPEKVHKLVLASMFYKRTGAPDQFWEFMKHGTFKDMPEVYKKAFRAVNSDSAALMAMYNNDAHRMQNFTDWSDEAVKSIQAHTLIVMGDQDVPKPEHGAEMCRLMPHARLCILPGQHGSYMGEAFFPDNGSRIPAFFVALVNEFLAGED